MFIHCSIASIYWLPFNSQDFSLPSTNTPDHKQSDTKPAPYGFWRTFVIVLCGHLGVRPAHKRVEDFQRANGVHVFAVAVMYFVLVIIGLIVLVNVVAG